MTRLFNRLSVVLIVDAVPRIGNSWCGRNASLTLFPPYQLVTLPSLCSREHDQASEVIVTTGGFQRPMVPALPKTSRCRFFSLPNFSKARFRAVAPQAPRGLVIRFL
ncbi:hypothetical protein KXJ81_19070 [Ensifer adhaerens]|nr:hypothetical protein [Ensifer adhaerens]